ncbi:hypothetical protein [Ottowia oryzae]|uniref:IPTL-CTERM protein sorting domain-containing protein n=1 Tax=Ottowia oryzae TaxID=2109914 RepID=A0A2S0MD75_9BURK|nr:hypothetical protein [Ottowia oryzae]AVO33818.1 hypothetical protein C6570_05810 [Ottowia oryzae]
MVKGIQVAVSLALMGVAGGAAAQSFVVSIDAKSNLFYAGTGLTPSTGNCTFNPSIGLGDGVYPPNMTLPAGLRAIQITTSNAGVSFGGGGFPAGTTPDGHQNAGSSAAPSATVSYNSSGTMPGLQFSGRYGTLAAVFLDGATLAPVSPYNSTALNSFTSADLSQATISRGLKNPFFIGDGTVTDWVAAGGTPNGTEQRQTMQVPTGATRLFFGFADAAGVSGVNQCYMDNTGTINAAIVMAVSDDEGSVSAGSASTAVADVRTNDYLAGATPTAPRATLAQGSGWPAGITLNTTTGAVNVAASVAAGDYGPLSYTLCDTVTTPASCAGAAVTVHVSAAPLTPVVANYDSGTVTTAGGTAVANVRANDTVGAAAATSANSTLAVEGIWPTGITFDTSTGAVSVASGVAAGTYTVAYKLCEQAAPGNCKTTNVEVQVNAAGAHPISAGNDPLAVDASFSGAAGNVLGNDSVNNAAATPTNATLAQVGTWPAGVSLDASGNVNVTGALADGTYNLIYRLCEAGATPANCTTATVTLARATPVPATGPLALGLMALALMGLGGWQRKRQ